MAEHMTPVVAKVLPEEKAAFAAATQLVGTTPSNASPNGAFGKDCPQQLVVEERPQ